MAPQPLYPNQNTVLKLTRQMLEPSNSVRYVAYSEWEYYLHLHLQGAIIGTYSLMTCAAAYSAALYACSCLLIK
jgi:hypothetical protein